MITGNHNGLVLYVYTVFGKYYRHSGEFSYYDKTLDDRINRMMEQLPISKMVDLNNTMVQTYLEDFKDEAIFGKYMKIHSFTEFMTYPTLLESIAKDLLRKLEGEE